MLTLSIIGFASMNLRVLTTETANYPANESFHPATLGGQAETYLQKLRQSSFFPDQLRNLSLYLKR